MLETDGYRIRLKSEVLEQVDLDTQRVEIEGMELYRLTPLKDLIEMQRQSAGALSFDPPAER